MKVFVGLLALTLCTVACDRREDTPTEAEDTVIATGDTGNVAEAATSDAYGDQSTRAADPSGLQGDELRSNNPATESDRDGADTASGRDGTMSEDRSGELDGDGSLRDGATGSDSRNQSSRDDAQSLQRSNGTSPATPPTPVP